MNKWGIAEYYTLTKNDIEITEEIMVVLDLLCQFCVLRNPGWSLGNTQKIHDIYGYMPPFMFAEPS